MCTYRKNVTSTMEKTTSSTVMIKVCVRRPSDPHIEIKYAQIDMPMSWRVKAWIQPM